MPKLLVPRLERKLRDHESLRPQGWMSSGLTGGWPERHWLGTKPVDTLTTVAATTLFEEVVRMDRRKISYLVTSIDI